MSSSPVTSKVGTLMVFRSEVESGRSAMPRCTWATFSGDILRIMRSAPSTRSGRLSLVVLPSSLGIILSKNGSVPRSKTSAAACKRPALASARIGWRFGVEQSQGSDPSTVPAPELEQHVPSDGNSGERHTSNFRVVEDASEVRGMFFHRGGAFADTGVSVTAQVGKDQLIARSECMSSGEPEFMTGRERMQQHYRRAGSDRSGMRYRRRHS